MATDPTLGLPPIFQGQLRATENGNEIFLPTWAAILSSGVSADATGWVLFDFCPDESLDSPTPAQIAMAERLILDQAAIGQAIIAGLTAAIPKIHALYADAYYGADAPWPQAETIGRAVSPVHVYVHDVGEDGALIGVELNCDWDPEHGLGIIMRDTDVLGVEVLGVDTADAAFLDWVARAAAKGQHAFFIWTRPVPQA